MENTTAGEAPVLKLDTIKPDASGKYSPLLHKWLTSKKRVWFDYQHVFQTKFCFDPSQGFRDHWSPNEIIIGHGDFDKSGAPCGIGGRKLRSIISGERGSNASGFYWTRGHGFRDITAEFWATYQRIGRCAWDHSHTMHMIGDENRWHYIAGGRQRECQWCGRVFEAITTMVPVIEFKERTDWSEYAASAPATLLHPMGSCGEAV